MWTNLFDTDYFSQMLDNKPVETTKSGVTTYRGIDVSNRVYWGSGRTWSAGVSFQF